MKQKIKRHFILTSGRSGSNYLTNTLNQHPHIVNYGEVLGEWTLAYKIHKPFERLLSWRHYLDILYNSTIIYYFAQFISLHSHLKKNESINFKQKREITNIGIKDFAFLLRNRTLLTYLESSSDIKVIYLHRRNILKRYLSLIKMNTSGIVKTDIHLKNASVFVDIEDLFLKLKVYSQETKLEEEIVSTLPEERLLEIIYEEYFLDTASRTSTNNKVFKFLGVTPIPVESKQKKIGNDNLQEYIRNYEEVYKILKGTEFEEYLFF